jgi:hypothetical protein
VVALTAGLRIHATDVRAAGVGTVTVRTLASGPTSADTGRIARVSGRVGAVRRSGNGWRAELAVGAARVLVVGDPGSGIPMERVTVGALLRVTGIVVAATPCRCPAHRPAHPHLVVVGSAAGGSPGSVDRPRGASVVGGGTAGWRPVRSPAGNVSEHHAWRRSSTPDGEVTRQCRRGAGARERHRARRRRRCALVEDETGTCGSCSARRRRLRVAPTGRRDPGDRAGDRRQCTAAVGVDDAAAVVRAGVPFVVAATVGTDGAVAAVPAFSPLGAVSASSSPDGGVRDRGLTAAALPVRAGGGAAAVPDGAADYLPLALVAFGLAAAGVAFTAGAWVMTGRIRRRRALDARVAARLAALAGSSPGEGPRGFRPTSLSLDAREGVSLSSPPTRAAQARRL